MTTAREQKTLSEGDLVIYNGVIAEVTDVNKQNNLVQLDYCTWVSTEEVDAVIA